MRLVAIDWPKEDRTYKPGRAPTSPSMLETKAMQQNMVVVSASEIGKSLTAQGKVAIYGIYFDTGKADIKPESRPSLDQIAAFLKTEPGVKLHVVGHTDSVGGFDSNLALSRRRAEAAGCRLGQGPWRCCWKADGQWGGLFGSGGQQRQRRRTCQEPTRRIGVAISDDGAQASWPVACSARTTTGTAPGPGG